MSFRITKGNVHDTKQSGPLIKESAKKHDIDKVYGDKAYDNRKNFMLNQLLVLERMQIAVKNCANEIFLSYIYISLTNLCAKSYTRQLRW
jgi:hypothetical protein